MSLPIDSIAVAEDGTVRIDIDVLRLALEGLDACAKLPASAAPEQIGSAQGRCMVARIRLELWLRDCADKREEVAV